MRDAGILYSDEIIADGRLHRFHIEGHKPCTKNGAYVAHCNGGCIVVWEAKQQREAEIRQRHKEATSKAVSIWRKSKPIARRENHPYLIIKYIHQHSARLYHESLVIPDLQRIRSTG